MGKKAKASDMMKRKIELLVFVIIIAVGLGLYLSAKPTEAIVDKMLDNPNEYNNGIYLNNITAAQQNQVLDSFDVLLAENCKNGELDKNCTLYFLTAYLKASAVLKEYPLEPEQRGILESTYLDLKSKYETLTENDLKGFTVPLLTRFCNASIFNGAEKIYWMRKLLDVNKTEWHSTDMQNYYIMVCMKARNVTYLSEITGIDREELNDKICNFLPSLNDVNTKDLCYVNDYLRNKKFCEKTATAEDINIADDLLSKEYDTYYQKACKKKLLKALVPRFIKVGEV